ncbi:MAG: hypothetical protein DMD33_12785 [Gemmatimonadetes bacterium]|nr:MAG: hypothetical protein DMD33_12785 [Gemmatimonadota bacterium]
MGDRGRPGLPIRGARPRHAGAIRVGACPLDRWRVHAVRSAVAAHRGSTRRSGGAHGDRHGGHLVPPSRCGRDHHEPPQHTLPAVERRGAGRAPPGGGGGVHDLSRQVVGRAAAGLLAAARRARALHGRAHQRWQRRRPAPGRRQPADAPHRDRRRDPSALGLNAPDRRAPLRRHDVPHRPTARRGALQRVRRLGKHPDRHRAGAFPLGLGAVRQPAARQGCRHDQRAHRPPSRRGWWRAACAEPERQDRRIGRLALVVARRPRRVRHVELGGWSGIRDGTDAAAARCAGRPAAVRTRDTGAHRDRRGCGDGTDVRPGSRLDGRRYRAAGAPWDGAHGARVDGAPGHHRPAVNVYFHTFGCRANQYDTALVRQAFEHAGAAVVEDPAAADVAVINSCTVTHESEAKLGRLVRRLARQSGRVETVVMGCAAALDDGRIAGLPSVRAVLGGADPAQVLRAAGLGPHPLSPSPAHGPHPLSPSPAYGPHPLSPSPAYGPHPLSPSPFGRGGTTGRFRGLLKIQDGCDEHCTFCATTLARGANRSRSIAELVEEARALAEQHAEIVLTGVHIGTYGQDRERGAGSGTLRSLGELLEALIEAVPEVRFRLSSIEATEVDDTIARLLIEAQRHLAAHLHAPLQSGSDRILKRMGRHWYTAGSYRARLEWLADRLPVFGLGADIIAGFPGETDADHRATLALVDALPFTYLHVFPYSERPGAAAARLPEQVAPPVVRERARELRELGEAKARAYRATRLGRRADGVVSGRGSGKVELLTEDYLSVYLPSNEWSGRARCEVTVS